MGDEKTLLIGYNGRPAIGGEVGRGRGEWRIWILLRSVPAGTIQLLLETNWIHY